MIVPKVTNRKHCPKVMYMGIIGPPVYKKDEHGEFVYKETEDGKREKIPLFDGKIMCKRVSCKEEQKRESTNQSFVDKHVINEDIKNTGWKELLIAPNGISVEEALDIISYHYGMDDIISEKLCFTYYTWKTVTKHKFSESSPPTYKKKEPICIKRGDKNSNILVGRTVRIEDMSTTALTLDDLILHVAVEAGTLVERDCSCNSDFMEEHIHEIVTKIGNAYKNVTTVAKPIVLFMDNAGGHGCINVKKSYEIILCEQYNILVFWQVANSPESNLLDLGAWMALQSVVEKKHRMLMLNKDVLANTVEAAFLCLDDAVITHIHERWLKVLDLIIKDNGNNDLVESDRGLKHNPLNSSEGSDTNQVDGEEDVTN